VLYCARASEEGKVFCLDASGVAPGKGGNVVLVILGSAGNVARRWAFAAAVACGGAVRANCINGITPIDGQASNMFLFPNWIKAYVGAFQPDDWAVDCGAGAGGALLQVAGLTIVNFGSAVGGTDIKAVYWRSDANAAGYLYTMTYAGLWGGTQPTWTWKWNGVEVNPDLAAILPNYPLRLYLDMAPEPSNYSTVQMGIPGDPVDWYYGGFSDRCGCFANWGDTMNSVQSIVAYIAKFVDEINAAPGDTLHYTIYYAKPGTGNIKNVQITDTQPPYTHWNYVANPLPDPGWDPNPGPPLKLRWTVFPAATPVAGGATGMVTFQLTVDWGNGDSFEAGSGNTAAPEGYSLWNNAHGAFPVPPVTAGNNGHVSNNTRTTVMRFLFWKVADRDIVYNCTPTTCDEITYSIFIRNQSAEKTWWNVSIWDTCPLQTNPWGPDCGVEDFCIGWTMTPSGCAAAGAGRILNPPNTILTWRLDMPPLMTLTIRWKAKISYAANVGQTVINKVSILEYGRTRIVDGTGYSGKQRNFTHKAPVMLRTTYVSYVAFNAAGTFGCGGGYFICIYPLHPSSAFQLLRYHTTACVDGVNPSITTPSPAMPCNTWPGPGCDVGIERRPQYYGLLGCAVTYDYYKLISNAPLLWECQTQIAATDEDSMMYATTTSLSFRGNTSYTYRRGFDAGVIEGDYLGICNVEDQPTTVFLFMWDDVNIQWNFMNLRTIDNLSQYMTGGTSTGMDGHWKIISSDSDFIIWKGYTFTAATDKDNYVTMVPADTGNLAAGTKGDEFWAYSGPSSGAAHHGTSLIITNLSSRGAPGSGTTATVGLMGYASSEQFNVEGSTPMILGGASGTWSPITQDDIPSGIGQAASPFNPDVYGQRVVVAGCMNTKTNFKYVWELVRVQLKNNVPIQVRSGKGGPGKYGGYTIHGLDSSGKSDQTVDQFWFWFYPDGDNRAGTSMVGFCPSTGMGVGISTDDVNYTGGNYTTTGPDQPVVKCDPLGTNAPNCGSFWIFKLAAASAGKRMIGMVCGSYFTERHYACPFLSTGTHYNILAPAVVFAGQSFWITVVVLDTGGGTKCDYTGTTSFTSTDPTAKIETKAMDTYNYTWKGATDCGVKLFFNVTLNRMGLINLVANDTADGSITGMTSIMVVGAEVKLTKQRKLTVAASGDTVQFQVCWENVASATAFSFEITDAMPMGTTYVPEIASTTLCWSNAPVPGVIVWYSTATTTTPPGTFTSVPGTGSPLANTRWLRWTVRDIYVRSSGCVCYKVSVN